MKLFFCINIMEITKQKSRTKNHNIKKRGNGGKIIAYHQTQMANRNTRDRNNGDTEQPKKTKDTMAI